MILVLLNYSITHIPVRIENIYPNMSNAVTEDARILVGNRSQEDVFGNDGNIAKDYFDCNINKLVFAKS